MRQQEIIRHSILIVSSSERFDAAVKRALPQGSFQTIDVKKSASVARRSLLEKDYDIIVVSVPLPGETGLEFALDAAEQKSASVVLAVPREIYEEVLEHVIDRGMQVLPKPLSDIHINRGIRFSVAIQDRLREKDRKLSSMQEKLEELRVVSRAKLVLVEQQHMTEDEAHRYIGKQAMDSGLSRRRVAEGILEEMAG